MKNLTAKGHYNVSDLNRVSEAVQYIAELLKGYGYKVDYDPILIQHGTSTTSDLTWKRNDIPIKSQMDQYIKNIRSVREAFPVYETTPVVPLGMDQLTWEQANDIEKILFDLNEIITKMEKAWLYSGDLYSGDLI